MQGFHILETGGREKFLKKKKDKKAKVQQDNKQLSLVLRIQKNIQRFLQMRRANEAQQSKIEIENQSKQKQHLWKYWLLTPYHVRAYKRGYYMNQFWNNCFNSLNQVQSWSSPLVNRMTKLTIEFLSQILVNDPKQGLTICMNIFGLIKRSQYNISKSQAQSFIHALSLSSQSSITKLKKDFLDNLLSTNNTKSLGMDLLTDEFYFIQYLMIKRKDILNGNLNFVQIQQMVSKRYPNLLEKSFHKREFQRQEGDQWVWKNYEQLTKLYTSILKWLHSSKRPPQVLMIWIAFLNNITLKLKVKTLQQINAKNKINPNIFGSQEVYQEYIQEKEQYFYFKQILTGGDYEKTKTLIKRALEVIMIQKDIQIPSKQLVYEQAIQYVNQVLMAFGQIDLLPMNQSVNFFLDNVSESTIYGLGKQSGFSFTKNNLSLENKMLLALNITLKAAVQTPDLHFTKFYQEQTEKDKLKKLIKEYLLKTLKHTMFLPHTTPTVKLISHTTITLLENFYNKIFRTNIILTQVFESSSFAYKLKSYQFRKNVKDQVSLFLSQFPYVFPLSERALKFRQILRQDKRHIHHHHQNFHHQESDDSEEEVVWNHNVKIRRNYEFLDAFHQLKKRDLRGGFRVTFINQLGFEEKGHDAGGLTKEFLNRVLKEALNPNYGMFIENSVHELLPHPIKAQLSEGIETQYYEFIGKLIGLAIYLNITLGYKFSGTFLNAIVGKKNTFDDLKTIDPELYNSLVYIKDMQEDASELGLTFLYTDNIRKKNIQLLPNGHLIHVTNQNKRQYISLLSAYKVNRLLEHQTRFIRKGLTSTINKEWLFMFNYEELNYIISGQGVIDVNDLRKYTKVIGFDKKTETIRFFWQVVMDFTEQRKSKLLMFVTACPRPSFLGFRELSPPFTISCMKDRTNLLPISHTCSNILELPDYNDKETLKKKLITAIESNAGFEFG